MDTRDEQASCLSQALKTELQPCYRGPMPGQYPANTWGEHSQAETPYTTARMPRPGSCRDRQRGNSLLLALIVMSSLATLGSLTVVSVQSSLKASTNDRSQTVAMYAAESGGAFAMEFLRARHTDDWNLYLATPPGLPCAGNGVLPGAPGNPFSLDLNAWYEVQIVNNRNDPGPGETDKQVIIRSTGHGPQGSLAILEWEVQWVDNPLSATDPLILVGWHVVL